LILYDEFGFEIDQSPAPQLAEQPHVPIREAFPAAGVEQLGGYSDGWEYRSVFSGSKLAFTYEMVRQFLQEEGYGDVPIPETAEDLKRFRRPKQVQLSLWAERGYIHNPIKILFSDNPKQRNTLILCLYNEAAKGHLLRFHGVD
jgi:hypothetical protein